jgi:ubiquinone/menaquinone biosynthesis C-methylase UbiE
MFEKMKVVGIDSLLHQYGLQGGRVLEYGCGTAGISLYLVNQGFHAVACDVSLNALRCADLNRAQHVPDTAPGTFRLVNANAMQLPFATNSFDIVMSYGLLEHFPPEVVDVLLAEIVRTLRPGGLFLADIVHSRFSVRTLGLWLSFMLAVVFYAYHRRWRAITKLPHAFFGTLYENDLNDRKWVAALQRAGLKDVTLHIYHPFPPINLTDRLAPCMCSFCDVCKCHGPGFIAFSLGEGDGWGGSIWYGV